MARTAETQALTKNTYTELTNANTTAITFQNISGRRILVKGTAGTSAPTDDAGALWYEHGQGEANTALSDLWPGMTALRVWAKIDIDGGLVVVSHA